MNAPHVVVLVPEHANHNSVQKVLQIKASHGLISGQHLAIMALERRHRGWAILQGIPDDRAERTNMWDAHVAATLHVPNGCKWVLGRRIVIDTKRTALGALQVRRQRCPRGVGGNQVVENGGRHLVGNENL